MKNIIPSLKLMHFAMLHHFFSIKSYKETRFNLISTFEVELDSNTMNTKLAVFDFDETIFKLKKPVVGLIELYPNGQPPEHVAKLISERAWDKLKFIVPPEISAMPNITKDIIWQALANCGEFVEGIDEVIKHYAQDHDIIIVSGTLNVNVEAFLEKYDLLKHITKIYGIPSEVIEDGKFFVNQRPNEWGGSCEITGRNFCKESILKYHLSQINHQYEQMVYFGDGSNDFCVARSLGTKDIVFPREGFKLVAMLEKEPISAEVIPWTNGKDVMNKIW